MGNFSTPVNVTMYMFSDITCITDGYKRWFARKRRRRGSRSVSGMSSDRSATHVTLTCTAATCSDSSGELMSWGSDFSEIRIPRHREGRGDNSGLSFTAEKEGVGSGSGLVGTGGAGQEKDPLQGNESGYGSEPGYRGDAELGYGDEFDEDEEFDARHLLFWGDHRIRGAFIIFHCYLIHVSYAYIVITCLYLSLHDAKFINFQIHLIQSKAVKD